MQQMVLCRTVLAVDPVLGRELEAEFTLRPTSVDWRCVYQKLERSNQSTLDGSQGDNFVSPYPVRNGDVVPPLHRGTFRRTGSAAISWNNTRFRKISELDTLGRRGVSMRFCLFGTMFRCFDAFRLLLHSTSTYNATPFGVHQAVNDLHTICQIV